jgi:hypothetical protein
MSSETRPRRLAFLRTVLASRFAPAALAVLLFLALAAWAMPVPIELVVTEDGTGRARVVTTWDTSRWLALSAFWWQALLLALALAVVLGAWYGRGWALGKVSAARFFAASVLFHCLLLLSLGTVPLARAVVERAESIRVSQAAELLDEAPTGSQGGVLGRPAYEKVADLPAEEAVKPQLVRQTAAPVQAPGAEGPLAPTIPAHAVRALPPERVLFVPPRAIEVERRPLEIERRGAPAALRPVELPLEMPELPPPEAAPRERPIEGRPVTQARQEASAPPVGGPGPLRLPELKRARPSDLRPDVAAPPVRERAPAPVELPLRRQPTPIALAEPIEDKVVAQLPIPSRKKEERQEAVKLYGGTKASEAAVERGLDWLAAHQSPNGSWGLNHFHVNCKHPRCADAGTVASDPAGTGVALLPFLGAGHTPTAGKHRHTVTRALHWLVSQQQPNGTWLARDDARPMYGHALASIALCEAYGMTQDAKLRKPAQKALDYIVKAQHPASGGWRYHPNQSADTSVVGWQLMALKSGEMAGLSVPPKTFAGIKRWLASVEGNKPVGGLFGYQSATPTPAMTAQGLLCLQYLGARRDDPRMRAGTNYLLAHLPRQGAETSYYWYHATQVMYHMQGKHWKAWNDKLRDLLVSTQETRGALAGSWQPVDHRERPGGRVYATALRLLMLEVYYRHLPLYQQLEK